MRVYVGRLTWARLCLFPWEWNIAVAVCPAIAEHLRCRRWRRRKSTTAIRCPTLVTYPRGASPIFACLQKKNNTTNSHYFIKLKPHAPCHRHVLSQRAALLRGNWIPLKRVENLHPCTRLAVKGTVISAACLHWIRRSCIVRGETKFSLSCEGKTLFGVLMWQSYTQIARLNTALFRLCAPALIPY